MSYSAQNRSAHDDSYRYPYSPAYQQSSYLPNNSSAFSAAYAEQQSTNSSSVTVVHDQPRSPDLITRASIPRSQYPPTSNHHQYDSWNANAPPSSPPTKSRSVYPVRLDAHTNDEPHLPTYNNADNYGSGHNTYGDTKSPSQPTRSERGNVLEDPKVQKELAKLNSHRPYFSWVLSGIHIIMVLVSLIINFQRTGSPIETSPDFNPFIGPAPGVLISMGARFYPCMHPGTSLDGVQIQCPAGSVSATGGTVCTLAELCGFSGKPDQWYRLILPIFLHGGIVHLLLNLVFQLRTAAQLERDWGWWRVALIYFISGIAGFLFGASYSGNTPSVGASGALYGLIACLLLDLLQNWRIIVKPVTELIKLLFLIIISFGIGMLPFVDNFAHVGGFVTGLFAGLLLIPTIHFGKGDKWRKLGFRIASVPVLIAIYVFLIQSFVTGAECSWCKYVNCIPGLPWCAQKWGTA